MSDKKKHLLLASIVFCFCLLIAFEAWKIFMPEAEGKTKYIYSLLTTVIGSALFLFTIIYCSYSRVLKISMKAFPRHLLLILPCLLVAVNNFPIIPFLSGRAYISGAEGEIFLYFLVCLGTGLFEELVFRGYIFMMMLERNKGGIKGIFTAVVASSAIFGLTHILNIFSGADPFSTLLQVGYSFLVGGMCSIVVLKTHSVWYAVILHAVYNFAGGVIPRFGGGTVWDMPTVVLTVILTVLVAVYMIFILFKTDVKQIDDWMASD